MADKSIQEVQLREEWRVIREEALLLQLHDVKLEGFARKE
jgi:aspartyl/asparaginyl beta-hydroxylase (cupin superfamily)